MSSGLATNKTEETKIIIKNTETFVMHCLFKALQLVKKLTIKARLKIVIFQIKASWLNIKKSKMKSIFVLFVVFFAFAFAGSEYWAAMQVSVS